ncbi:hypothetical protein A2V56_03640 [Candidatus Woesebacteria bacterium RBG_19FT_COMBO_42_9]|uniref:Uncharacterized protein n=1 Tax=Candidatus Woesebacteria bacterium RBG_16_42_24 TaxID=1802485 RepID=A0A1F7XJU0_9BACT|nr:MAG: hypothetical protein A2V97_01630 [Candidatus Woesebacteria bacterium RBG_16_42_24]OGM16838.1 MAG: hypothetical protein A2V56_03640 [Candidatus Woesebacteria bacterium RBG_19FT_COMBO_42_9]OGM67606.1 MAG: hypothetical protein A2985_00370 [Candidatus Woesebacteria bacterium RIFCSPLOWO2_01_FULL_43_11]
MQKFLAPTLSFLAILGVISSYYFLYSLNKKVESITPQDVQKEEVKKDPTEVVVDECGEECEQKIEEEVAKAISTISASTKTTTAPSTTTTLTKKSTDYITLNGPVSTTSTQWVDIPGVEVYLDLVKDYGSLASASWEGSLKVAHANGQAYARLFDITNGRAVDGSEISTSNNADYKLVSSAPVSFWAGNNLYRLQLKSLNSFEVTFLSGRIKITY